MKFVTLALVAAGAALVSPVLARDGDGVKIGHASYLRKLYPASFLESSAGQQYNELTRQAFQKGVLVASGDPQYQRLQRIQQDLLPHSYKFNDRAKDWK